MKAAALGEEAKRLGFDDLRERYTQAAVADVAKSGDNPGIFRRLLGTCVKPKPNLIERFQEAAASVCAEATR